MIPIICQKTKIKFLKFTLTLNIISFLPKNYNNSYFLNTLYYSSIFHGCNNLAIKVFTADFEKILKRSSIIVSSYPDDAKNGLGNELVHFSEVVKTDVAAGIDSKKHETLHFDHVGRGRTNFLAHSPLNIS